MPVFVLYMGYIGVKHLSTDRKPLNHKPESAPFFVICG